MPVDLWQLTYTVRAGVLRGTLCRYQPKAICARIAAASNQWSAIAVRV